MPSETPTQQTPQAQQEQINDRRKRCIRGCSDYLSGQCILDSEKPVPVQPGSLCFLIFSQNEILRDIAERRNLNQAPSFLLLQQIPEERTYPLSPQADYADAT